MKKIKITLVLLVVLCLFVACSSQVKENEFSETSQQESEIVEKEVVLMGQNSCYNGYTSYESAINKAEMVVYGEIVEIGEPFIFNGGIEEHVIKYYYTPIVIKVTEWIKGDDGSSTVIYHALGAEMEDVIYDYEAFDTLDFKKGDKLLVFLKENQSIGPDCVIGEDENGIATRSTLDQRMPNYPLEKHVELARKAYARMTEKNK